MHFWNGLCAGFYDRSMVRDMLKECSRMSKFNHVNVLTLKGVCLDGGPAPYIVMPYMANGSLLAYLKKNRKTLVLSYDDQDYDNDDVSCSNMAYSVMNACAGWVMERLFYNQELRNHHDINFYSH